MNDEEITRRFVYHAPGPRARLRHDVVRGAFRGFALEMSDNLSDVDGREVALFFTHLEEAAMWAHAAIARGPFGES